MNNIDLHTHSSYSDGTFSPLELIDQAAKNNLGTLSITDHDTMAATDEALKYCQQKDIKYLSGVEISTHVNNMSLHLLGYNVDHNSESFINFLDTIQEARAQRNENILRRLNRMGIKISLSDIIIKDKHFSQIGRPHIAQLLVKKRVVSSDREAFSRYLKKNAAAYVQRKIMPTEEAIAEIHAAGGLAVFAHPASLGMSEKSLTPLIAQLKGVGLDGIEIYHPLHSDKNIAFLEKLCHKNNLIKTGGSDFHGRERDKTKLGEYGYNKSIPGSLITNINKYSAES